jgi:predicted oxidoreductase
LKSSKRRLQQELTYADYPLTLLFSNDFFQIQTFDTADYYSNGHSEILLGKAIKEIGAPRDSFVIMTKVFFPHEGPDMPDRHIYAQRLDPDQHGYVIAMLLR